MVYTVCLGREATGGCCQGSVLGRASGQRAGDGLPVPAGSTGDLAILDHLSEETQDFAAYCGKFRRIKIKSSRSPFPSPLSRQEVHKDGSWEPGGQLTI